MSSDLHAIVARRRLLRELATQVTHAQSQITQLLTLIVEASASPDENSAQATRIALERGRILESLTTIQVIRTALLNQRVPRPLSAIAHPGAATPSNPNAAIATGHSQSLSVFPLLVQPNEPSIPALTVGQSADALKLAQGGLDDQIDEDVPLEQHATPLPQTLSALEGVQMSLLKNSASHSASVQQQQLQQGQTQNPQQQPPRSSLSATANLDDPHLCGVDATTGLAVPAALAALEPAKLTSWRGLLSSLHVRAARSARHLRHLISQTFPQLSLTVGEAHYAVSERCAYRDDSGDLIRGLIPSIQPDPTQRSNIQLEGDQLDCLEDGDLSSTDKDSPYFTLSAAYLRRAEQRALASRALGTALNAFPPAHAVQGEGISDRLNIPPGTQPAPQRGPSKSPQLPSQLKLSKLLALGESMAGSTSQSIATATIAEDLEDLISGLARTGGTGAGGSGMMDHLGRGMSGFSFLFGRTRVPFRNVKANPLFTNSSPSAIVFEVPYVFNMVISIVPAAQRAQQNPSFQPSSCSVGEVNDVAIYALTESLAAKAIGETLLPSSFPSMRVATMRARDLLEYLKQLPTSSPKSQQITLNGKFTKPAQRLVQELALISSLASTRATTPSTRDVSITLPWLRSLLTNRTLQICFLLTTWARLAYGRLFTAPYSSLDPYSTLSPSPYSSMSIHARNFPRTVVGAAPSMGGGALFELEYRENDVDMSSLHLASAGGRRILGFAPRALDKRLGRSLVASTVSIPASSPLTARLTPVTTAEAHSPQALEFMQLVADRVSAQAKATASRSPETSPKSDAPSADTLAQLDMLIKLITSTAGEASIHPLAGVGFATSPGHTLAGMFKQLETISNAGFEKLHQLVRTLRELYAEHPEMLTPGRAIGIQAIEQVAKSLGITLDGLVRLMLLA